MHTARVLDAHKKYHDLEISHLNSEKQVRDHLSRQFPGSEILSVLPVDLPEEPEPTNPLLPPPEGAETTPSPIESVEVVAESSRE